METTNVSMTVNGSRLADVEPTLLVQYLQEGLGSPEHT